MTDRGIKSLKDLPLQQLSLSGCKHIKDVFNDFNDGNISECLKVLDISNCQNITDSALPFLTFERPLTFGLQELNLNKNPQLTDKGIEKLGYLMNLKSLNLEDCTKVTGACFEKLSTLNHLEFLNVRDCTALSDVALFHMRRFTPTLKMLILLRSPLITQIALNDFKKRYRGMIAT